MDVKFMFGNQYSAEIDWVGEYEITAHYVMWWRVSIEGHIRDRKKGFGIVFIFCVWYYDHYYCTALLVGRSQDRFPVVSLGIFSVATDRTMYPGVDSSSKNEYQGFLLG
jgi:hypothetical protein